MEPLVNEWDLVIKVKYADTLRRFGAYVHGQSMDHDMSKLKAKIISLFKFSPDADLILTYTDEDGDVVTLDDNEELHDAAISQHLNPLRINVQLKSNICGSSDPKSQTTFAPVSPQIETNPHLISSAVDVLKSVPEPIRTALSKLSHDFVLKTASSAPALAELAEYFSKFGLSNISQPSHDPTGESSCVAMTNLAGLGVSDEPKVPTKRTQVTIVQPKTNSGYPVHIPSQNGSAKMSQGKGDMPTSVDLNLDPPKYPHVSEFPYMNDLLSCPWTTSYGMELEREGCDTGGGKSDILMGTPSVPPADQTVEHSSEDVVIPRQSVPPNYTCGLAEVLGDNNCKQIPIIAAPTSQFGYNPQFDLNRRMSVPTPAVPLPSLSFPIHPYRRGHSYHDNLLRTFHRGVQCDGCGMQPITGPRFKSNVKEDYDLCSFCFSEVGNEADYTRIERASCRPPRVFKELFNPHSRYRLPSHAFHSFGTGPSRVKLESRFIQDVTVVDGTVMPPCTPFTKIWRMRNNGTVAWPFGTQLIWIGGDQFGNRVTADLEIPVIGCPVNEEIDIAVDFTAPSKSGRYISYWRMASPSGHKFGQRVWVIILVENPRQNSVAGSFHADLNLNLPPESSDRNGLGIVDMNIEPPLSGAACPESVEPVNTAATPSTTSVEPVALDGLLGYNDGAQGAPKTVPPISYPIIDFPASSSSAPPPVVDGAEIDGNLVEQTLLKELEEMGFQQIDLNKEVLRLNEYDLEQSVDDLCGFAEWDPLLTELHEMGFCDKELNKKLLVKNGGSIKRAVLDLISGEKDD